MCHDYDGMILLGDFNLQYDDNCSGFKLLKNLLDDYKLLSCEDCADPPIEYTYFQENLGRFSVIDHMFISCSLYCNIIKYVVVDSGINLLDHVPVQCVIAFPSLVGNNGGLYTKKNNPDKKLCNILRWDKGDVTMYYYITALHLQYLQVPYDLLSCNCDGYNCSHQSDINKYYNDIIDVMDYAAKCTIPTVCSSSSKA